MLQRHARLDKVCRILAIRHNASFFQIRDEKKNGETKPATIITL